MVALERINVRETVGRKNNCKLNFFSMYFVRNNEEIHLSFKNSEKWWTQALNSLDMIRILKQSRPDFSGKHLCDGYFMDIM